MSLGDDSLNGMTAVANGAIDSGNLTNLTSDATHDC